MSENVHDCSCCGGEFDGINGRLAWIGGVLIAICPWCCSPIKEMFKTEIIEEYLEEQAELGH